MPCAAHPDRLPPTAPPAIRQLAAATFGAVAAAAEQLLGEGRTAAVAVAAAAETELRANGVAVTIEALRARAAGLLEEAEWGRMQAAAVLAAADAPASAAEEEVERGGGGLVGLVRCRTLTRRRKAGTAHLYLRNTGPRFGINAEVRRRRRRHCQCAGDARGS